MSTDYNNSDTFCMLPWIHLCVRPDEALKPCCRYLTLDDPVNVNLDALKNNGINEMNNDYLKKLRQDMLDGVKREECTKCYIQEQNSELTDRKSLRRFLNNRFSPYLKENYTNEFDCVRYIEMSLDNICNLQCKMCDSKFSSKLQRRDEFLEEVDRYKKLQPSFDKFENIDLSNLVYIKLLGGEPFVSPNFIKFLDYIEQRADPSKIKLEIATNGTKIPSKKIIEKLDKYEMLFINVSLDAYDKVNDYQRFGSNYKQTYKNAQTYEKIFKNIHVSFHCAVSLLTANKLADSLNFLIEENDYHVSVDFVRYPRYLSLLYAPQSYIDWVLEKNKNNTTASKLIHTLVKSGKYNEKQWFEFLYTTKKLDGFYNTNIKDYNPDLVAYIEENSYETYLF